MLIKNHTYTGQNSGLKIYIVKIQYQNDKYIKFKGVLCNKTCGIVYETKNYKLSKDVVKYWLDISEKV